MVQSDTIVVSVGSERRKYTLHKKLVIHRSEYFRKSLSSGFKESIEGVVVLADVDVDTFEIFVDWLYEKRLPEAIEACPSKNGGVTVKTRTYALADRFVASEFKQAIFDNYFTKYCSSSFPSYPNMAFGFANLQDKDPLLQLWIDAFCRHTGILGYQRVHGADPDPSSLPQQAMLRLLQTMHAREGGMQRGLVRSEYAI